MALPLQPGQRLLIIAPPEASPLVAAIAQTAFACGAADVTALYEDQQLEALRLAHTADALLGRFSPATASTLTEHAQAGKPILTLHAANPQKPAAALAARAACYVAARQHALASYANLRASVAFNWSVMAVATPSWASALRPDLPAEDALTWLWQRLAHLLRLDAPSPQAAWLAHSNNLMARCAQLQALDIAALELTAPGTALRIGLPRGHLWFGPRVASSQGRVGVPNMPTEEISTLPHRLAVDGKVRISKPLVLAGQLVEGLELTFKQGKLLRFSCSSGQDLFAKVIDTDEGARRLGEIALVPEDSLVAQEGRIFYSTLIDENASCHLALGRAYPVTLTGGAALAEGAFLAAGGNQSAVHLDLMFGSPQLQVDALSASLGRVTLMKKGLWVLP